MTRSGRWIIFDRDGTLIVEKNYLHDPDQVEMLPGAIEGLLKLKESGFSFVVATNQSGIGRGYYEGKDMDAVHSTISTILKIHGIKIAGYYHCPHTPEDGCRCRKPEKGLVEKAAGELGFKIHEVACVIGDKRCDVELAENLGVPSVLVLTGCGEEEKNTKGLSPSFTAYNLMDAAEIVISLNGGGHNEE